MNYNFTLKVSFNHSMIMGDIDRLFKFNFTCIKQYLTDPLQHSLSVCQSELYCKSHCFKIFFTSG